MTKALSFSVNCQTGWLDLLVMCAAAIRQSRDNIWASHLISPNSFAYCWYYQSVQKSQATLISIWGAGGKCITFFSRETLEHKRIQMNKKSTLSWKLFRGRDFLKRHASSSQWHNASWYKVFIHELEINCPWKSEDDAVSHIKKMNRVKNSIGLSKVYIKRGRRMLLLPWFIGFKLHTSYTSLYVVVWVCIHTRNVVTTLMGTIFTFMGCANTIGQGRRLTLFAFQKIQTNKNI